MAKFWRRGRGGGGNRWEPRKYYEKFAQKIVDQIEKGVAPWQKPWKPGERALPENFRTGNPYHGSNAVHFAMAATDKGYSDNRWGTYAQIKAAGGYVRRGEKATTGTYMSYNQRVLAKDEDGNPQKDENGRSVYVEIPRERPIPVPFKVFNVEQAEGLNLPERPEGEPDWKAHDAAEQVIRAAREDGVDFRHERGDRAFYSPSEDRVTIPPRDQFGDAGRYYQTAMHELGHATGHPNRLDRSSLAEAAAGQFGSPAYAREELRAEISGMMTSTRLGVGHNPRHGAAYVKSWAAVLKENPREILFASSEAQGMSDYLVERGRELAEKEKIQAKGPDSVDREPEIEHRQPDPERFEYRNGNRTAVVTRPDVQDGATEHHRRHAEQRHYLVTMEHRGHEGTLTAWANDSDDAHEKARRFTATGVAPTWSEHHHGAPAAGPTPEKTSSRQAGREDGPSR